MKRGTKLYVGLPVRIADTYDAYDGYGEPGWVGWIENLFSMYHKDALTAVDKYSAEEVRLAEAQPEWTVGVRFANGGRAHYQIRNLEALETDDD